jgi:uncharacterized protein YqeY
MLYDKISKDMVEAMKSHNKEKVSTLRLLKAAIDKYLIDNKMERHETTDETVIEVVSKQVKTLKESILEFEKGNRNDLVEGANREISVLNEYLPEQLSTEELNKIIDEVFDKIKPTSMKDMGSIMKELKPLVTGKADMKEVNAIIKEKLN